MTKPNLVPARRKLGAGRRLLALGLFLLLTWGTATIFLPDGPSYSLTDVTERIELEVAQSPAPLGWGGLEIGKIDGAAASCSIKTLPIGSLPLKIIITAPSERPPSA